MLIKVISTKTVFGDKAALQRLVLSDEKASHFLYRVLGQAEAYMQGKGRFQRKDNETGELTDTVWTKFAGDFIAVNRDGDEYESATCFLPEYVSGPILQSIQNGSEHTFGFDVYAKYSATSATSYEFIAQPMRRQGEESPAARLKATMVALPGNKVQAIEDQSEGGKKTKK